MIVAAIELDWNTKSDTEEGVLAEVKNELPGIGLKVRVTKLHGPAGGIPVIELRGSKDSLRRALKAYDAESYDELVELYGL